MYKNFKELLDAVTDKYGGAIHFNMFMIACINDNTITIIHYTKNYSDHLDLTVKIDKVVHYDKRD